MSTNASSPTSKIAIAPQFPALDTLRVVGAVAVVATHTSFWAGDYTKHGAIGSFLARLDVGVALFFVLSGFLLSRPWLARAQAGVGTPSGPRYYWKRVLRIFPVYIVTAVLALTFIRANSDRGLVDWLVTLGLGDIYVNKTLPDGLTQMWSLATEVAFYVVLPLLMLIGIGKGDRLNPRRVLALLAGMLALTPLWILSLSAQVPGAEHRSVNEWLPAFTSWFAVGIGLALLHVLYESGRLAPRVRRGVDVLAASPGVCWVGAFSLLLVAATPIAGPTMLISPSAGDLVIKNALYLGVGGLIVFTGVFAVPSATYARFLSLPSLRHLGHISYGVFCIHLPILHLVMHTTGYELFRGHGLQIFVLTLVASVLASELLYRAVELPFMRLRDVGRGSATKPNAKQSAATTK